MLLPTNNKASIMRNVIILAAFFGWLGLTLACLLTILIWMRHHENIARILTGDEPRIGSN